MPEWINCPGCKERLEISDSLIDKGKTIHCSDCGAEIDIGSHPQLSKIRDARRLRAEVERRTKQERERVEAQRIAKFAEAERQQRQAQEAMAQQAALDEAHRAEQDRMARPPAYSSLGMVATIMVVVGWLGLIGGAVGIVVAIITIMDTHAAPVDLAAAAGQSLYGGGISLLLGEAAHAFRDMARNSFTIAQNSYATVKRLERPAGS